MTTYENLMDDAIALGCRVKEISLTAYDGLVFDNKIAIRKTIPTTAQKTDVLAEEIGHVLFTVGDILDQTDVNNRKQEYTARKWAYEKRIGIYRLIDALEYGCRDSAEAAEYLGVSEPFLEEAIDYYHQKYGVYVETDKYILEFEPCINLIRMEDTQ